jgi:hypothetical protein
MRQDNKGLQTAHHAAGGFILVEVMVAIMIFALVLVPLATSLQRALSAGLALRGKASAFSQEASGDGCAEAWTWGPMVKGVAWRPGPELHIRVRAFGSTELVVGVWAGGWLLGEWAMAGECSLRVPSLSWSEVEGEELAVRVRDIHGTWGPPWRSIVPNEYCNNVGQPAAAEAQADLVGIAIEGRTVAHVRSYAAPLLRASWRDPAVTETVLGLAYLLPVCGPGYCELNAYGETQAWVAFKNRMIDVYF